MTNTRLTDPEILERRYPVILRQFSLAEDTGGRGQYRGGDGVLREIQFRKELELSVLTERRVLAPYGLAGGRPGVRGVNCLLTAAGRRLNLGGKCSVTVGPGDVFSLQTPGGGGWGGEADTAASQQPPGKKRKVFTERGSVFEYQQQQLSA